jgi:hypothetical protein
MRISHRNVDQDVIHTGRPRLACPAFSVFRNLSESQWERPETALYRLDDLGRADRLARSRGFLWRQSDRLKDSNPWDLGDMMTSRSCRLVG